MIRDREVGGSNPLAPTNLHSKKTPIYDRQHWQPHFFVVANRDPIGTKRLLLTIVTSNIEAVRRRNRERPETFIEVSPSDYDELKVDSAIDCNVVVEKALSELVGMVQRKEARYHRDLPVQIFAKLKAAVLASSVVAPEIKELL